MPDRRSARPAPDASAASPAATPTGLVVACAAVLLEVLALVVAAGVAVVGLIRGTVADPGAGAFIVAFALVLAALLLLCVRGLWRGRRWARGPVLTWQLLQAAVALPLIGDGQVVVGVALLVPVVVVVVTLLLLPSVLRATTGRGGGGGSGTDGSVML